MWIQAHFTPVAIFGLRPSNTTSSGGKSLLIPTPYAIKMALLDRMLRFGGEGYGMGYFSQVRDLKIAVHVPLTATVTRSFQKVLRPGGKKEVWTSTIARREYVLHHGLLTFAFEGDDDIFIMGELPNILASVNYFGRRGGFFQLTKVDKDTSAPDDSFTLLSPPTKEQRTALGFGYLQRMDDMRSDATFEDVSAFHKKGNKDDGGRISYTITLPYGVDYHGHNHTVYRRTDYTVENP